VGVGWARSGYALRNYRNETNFGVLAVRLMCSTPTSWAHEVSIELKLGDMRERNLARVSKLLHEGMADSLDQRDMEGLNENKYFLSLEQVSKVKGQGRMRC
jgi:hypothetical protein